MGWRRLTQLSPLFPMAEGHHVPLALPSSLWTANPTHRDSMREKKHPAHLSADQHRIWKEEDRAGSTVCLELTSLSTAKRVEKICLQFAGTGHLDNSFPVVRPSHSSL